MFSESACPARYAFAGLFQTEDRWLHPTRVIDSYEIILMLEGAGHLYEQEQRFTLHAGDALLLRPGRRHGGWQESAGRTSFYWIHFYLPEGNPPALPEGVQTIQDMPRLLMLCRQLLHIANTPGYPDYAAQAAFSLLYCEWLRLCGRQDAGSRLVGETAEWIRINSHRRLTVAGVARRSGYHPDYLSALFRGAFGRSLKQYIIDERMKRLRSLLLTTMAPLKTIAAQMEFASEEQLIHYFRYHEGISPARYRNLHYRTHLNRA